MGQTEPDNRVRESHPEVYFAALSADELIETSKSQDIGQQERLERLRHHSLEHVDTFEETQVQIELTAPWI